MNKCVFVLPLCVLVLSACPSNPKTGPSFSQISNMPVYHTESTAQIEQNLPKVEIIEMNDRVSIQLARSQISQSLSDLNGGKSINPDIIGLGDVLEIMLWESPPAVLFGGSINSQGAGTAQTVRLPEQIVSTQGTVAIPFLGNIKVNGKTPQQVQDMIVQGLQRKANRPQALVRLVQNNAANVTIIRAGKSVRMPLTAHRERVLDAIAAVGGVESSVQDISLQFTRGNQVRTVALESITTDPTQNILLRTGDVITLHTKAFSFTALGAVSRNQRVEFAAKGMNLSEAMGVIGGLIDRRSDPRGVFIFRYQPLNKLPANQQIAWRNQGYSDTMDIPTIYRFDLNQPHSLFWMQRFAMNDKDVIYVANAPASEIQKFLQLLFSPVVSGVSSVNSLAN